MDSELLKGGLKYFEVMQEIHLEIGMPLNFIQGNMMGKSGIKKLAINISWTQLLYFSQVGDDQVVDPLDYFRPRCEVRIVCHIFVIFNNIINRT